MKIARILSLLLAAALLLTATAFAAHAGWMEDVQQLMDAGIIDGDIYYYTPDDKLTLAEAAVMMDRVIRYPDCTVEYTDIDPHSEAAGAVSRLAGAGIVYVPSKDTCLPDRFISRQEAVTMLYKLFRMSSSGQTPGWSDYEYITNTNAINAFYSKGYIPEYMQTGNCFAPNMAITKSQFAAILNAVMHSSEVDESAEYTQLIGSCTTGFIAGSSGRNTNIELAAEGYVNGTVIAPGDTFSFNEVVGKRTWDRGFREATIFVGDKKEKGIGGGICQASTTIFVAALNAGMTITERHQHSMVVDYIDVGLDATVSYGVLDLKFRNDLAVPVKITCDVDVDAGTITVNFWTVPQYVKPNTYVGASHKYGKYYGYRCINGKLDWYTTSKF